MKLPVCVRLEPFRGLLEYDIKQPVENSRRHFRKTKNFIKNLVFLRNRARHYAKCLIEFYVEMLPPRMPSLALIMLKLLLPIHTPRQQ